ncbi:hypothetical protein SAMD00024442_28_28 [Candidatus Symbiothrix dinenymphae]|nr:hypothetical protein SAMD00024442_28_28 [Candidatus Symbiothrix dinenymphae]
MKKRTNIIKTIVIACLLVTGNWSPVTAQKAVISASIDTAQMLIGEQRKIHLNIAANKEARLQLPLITDTLTAGVEVLEISKFDTTDIGNNRMQIEYDYLVTSFDSALYLLPPFVLIEKLDTAYSQRLALKVSSMPVDTTSMQFFDIKDVMKPEFVWKDYAAPVAYSLLAILLIAAIVYVIYRRKKNKPLIPLPKKEKVVIPPHIQAIKALDEIKSEKLWQQGKEKEFHSQVSEVLREYIEGRFGINAMEQVSGEILDAVRGLSEVGELYNNLKQLLLTADLVKFAKYRPMPDENETSITNAYLFVNKTAPQPVPEQGIAGQARNDDNAATARNDSTAPARNDDNAATARNEKKLITHNS